MKEQYGEYEIRYSEHLERFEAYKGQEQVATSAKLSELRKRLDRVGDLRSKFQRFKVLTVATDGRNGGAPRVVEHEVTSVVHGDECWLVNLETKGRYKVKIGNRYNGYYADTPANRDVLAGVVELHKSIAELNERLNAEVKRCAVAAVPAGTPTELQ